MKTRVSIEEAKPLQVKSEAHNPPEKAAVPAEEDTSTPAPSARTSAPARKPVNKYVAAQQALREREAALKEGRKPPKAKPTAVEQKTNVPDENQETVWMACRASRNCDGRSAVIIHKEMVRFGHGMGTRLVRYRCGKCGGEFHTHF